MPWTATMHMVRWQSRAPHLHTHQTILQFHQRVTVRLSGRIPFHASLKNAPPKHQLPSARRETSARDKQQAVSNPTPTRHCPHNQHAMPVQVCTRHNLPCCNVWKLHRYGTCRAPSYCSGRWAPQRWPASILCARCKGCNDILHLETSRKLAGRGGRQQWEVNLAGVWG